MCFLCFIIMLAAQRLTSYYIEMEHNPKAGIVDAKSDYI